MIQVDKQVSVVASERVVTSAEDRGSFRIALSEIAQTLFQAPQWGALAWNDLRLRYRRTTLGPLWITLGLAATVFSVGTVYGGLFGNDLSDYLPYFATGVVAWTLVGSMLTEGCTTYLGAAGILKAVPVAPVTHVYRLMTRQLIMFGHNFLVIIALWLLFRWNLDWRALLVVPGFLLNVAALFGAVLTLSIVAARFRDIQLILTTVLQLVFLMTPIMFKENSLRGAAFAAAFVVDYNPFFHFIEIIRRPLLGEAASAWSWTACGISAAISLWMGIYFYARFRHRIAFWV